MPRMALDLNNEEDRQHVKAQWRVATGLVPGEPNEGLTSQLLATPARRTTMTRAGMYGLTSGRAFPWALPLPGTASPLSCPRG